MNTDSVRVKVKNLDMLWTNEEVNVHRLTCLEMTETERPGEIIETIII